MTTVEASKHKMIAEQKIRTILRELERDTECTVLDMKLITLEGILEKVLIDRVDITLIIK